MPEGRIHRLHVSQGGVPKLPVPRARLTTLGLEGDAVRNPDVHGGPDRALCLYALELIDALRAEGHPVEPGALGENVTTAGLDFSTLAPGDRIRLGDALVEVVSYTAPCRTIMHCFHDRAYGRISHKTHPGWSRVYARVLREGVLEAGMTATLERA